MAAKLYKILLSGRIPSHGGTGAWLPLRWRTEGDPERPITPEEMCHAGVLHLCRPVDLLSWLIEGGEVWEAQARGAIYEASDKIGCRQARITRRVGVLSPRLLRLFATDCAERALRRERERGRGREPDPRSWAAVEAARAYARGEIDDAARAAAWGAARDAARAAAMDAAWGAARAAARAAAMDAAWGAARAAARAAAWDAARTAARDAAMDAERQWQADRLLAYLRGEVG